MASHREKGDQILAFNAGDKARLVMAKLENKRRKPKDNFPSIHCEAWK